MSISLKDIQHIFAKQKFTISVCGMEQRGDSFGRFVVEKMNFKFIVIYLSLMIYHIHPFYYFYLSHFILFIY